MPPRVDVAPKVCKFCGRSYTRDSYKRVSDFKESQFCGRKCYMLWRSGENHPNWKGGTKTRPDGYIRDGRTDRYIHRLVMEEFLGRRLDSQESVHHINGNTSDNRLENLCVMTNSEHIKFEVQKRKRNGKGAFIS